MKHSMSILLTTLSLVNSTYTINPTNNEPSHTIVSANNYKNIVGCAQNIMYSLNYDIILYASLKNDARNIITTIQNQAVQFNDIAHIVEVGINCLKNENSTLHSEINNLNNLIDSLNQEIASITAACAAVNDLSQSEIEELLSTLCTIEATYDSLAAERNLFLHEYNVIDHNLNEYIEETNQKIRFLAYLAGQYEAVQEYDQSIHDHNLSSIDGQL